MIKETNKRITVTLTKEQIKQLEKESNKTGLSKSVIIKLAIKEYLKK